MFSQKTDSTADNLDAEINAVLLAMSNMNKTTDSEYPKMVTLLDTLYKLKNDSRSEGLSADAKATIIANLAGILLILHYEKVGVITSKALGLLQKIR
jgi:hypothetical protein